ncbi:hypothetical protein BKA62DRAFT_744536 [Auriculariales sp. MPI-PUGE-AT-0066]|nr:hypothetical protein BKA62DRAFT_744536 [Auriculariales sp. MPI-PUGE-AT-0066]
MDRDVSIPLLLARAAGAQGVYAKSNKTVSLVLHGQTTGCALPTCDDAQPLKGVVTVDKPAGITAIEVEIEGNIRLQEFGGLKRTTRILHETIPLWSAGSGQPAPPREIPFSYRMPGAGEGEMRLPPSFEVSIAGGRKHGQREANGFWSWIRYTLTIHVKGKDSATILNSHLKIPDQIEKLLDKEKSITVPILFASRLRSPHATMPSITQLLNEPSHYTPLTFALRNASKNLEPLHAEVHLARPATYCMRRPIPVCLRLQGTGISLDRFTVTLSVHRKSTQRILQNADNEDNWMESLDSIGEASMERVDGASTSYDAMWAGQVLVQPNIMAGSFSVEGLAVRDYLVLDIRPPSNKPGMLFVDNRVSVPILLTTD